MKIIIITCLILAVVTILFYSCSARTTRTLLTENQVYRWKVYHVKEHHFSVGTTHYFEVYLGRIKLVLPKELTGGSREVSRFISAGAYNSGETNYDSVLIGFEGFIKNEQGNEERVQMSIRVRVADNKKNTLEVYNCCNGKTAQLEIE